MQKDVHERLSDWFERQSNEVADIVRKAVEAASAQAAARKARDLTRRKGLLETAALPGKLSDCRRSSPPSARVCTRTRDGNPLV